MANSFFNFLTRFVSGTTVKAGPVNDRFTEVQSGFDNVETASKSSLKVTGYSSSSGITATPDSFLMLNASGTPYASATLSFSPNFGGFKAQNLGDGVSASDAITYGQAQTLINTAAYGSPTVVSLPSLSGNALKTLRVNAGGVATEWADSIPVASTSQADQLITSNGAWVRTAQGRNMLTFSSLAYTIGRYGVPTGWAMVYYPTLINGIYRVSPLVPWTSGEVPLITSVDYRPSVAAGAVVTASVESANGAGASLYLLLRFYDAGGSQVGTDQTTLISATTDSVFRRHSVTATAPTGTVSAGVGLKVGATGCSVGSIYSSHFQLESGSIATPWGDNALYTYLSNYMAGVQHSETTHDANVTIGNDNGGTARISLKTANTGDETRYGARLTASGIDAANGDADISWECKGHRLGKVAGYSALVVNGALGATPTIDFMAGAKQSGSLSANAVITLTAPPSDIVFEAKLYLQQDATGSRTATFASSAAIKHVGGSAKAPQAAANSETCYNVTWDGARFIISGYDL